MAGETEKAEAICLAVHPFSRTSHVVAWLTPAGRLDAVVKGAVRPKSAFLGQYDLNYTCEIVYYRRARGGLHALRECFPRTRRDALRGDWRALAAAGWCRRLAGELAPSGPDAKPWFAALAETLDALDEAAAARAGAAASVARLLAFELRALALEGLAPDFRDDGAPWSNFALATGRLTHDNGNETHQKGRFLRVSSTVAACLRNPLAEKNLKNLLDAERVIGVFYATHLDCAPEARRTVLRLVSEPERVQTRVQTEESNKEEKEKNR